MTATEPKREEIPIAVAVVTVKDDPEPRVAISLGEHTIALRFYDGLRLDLALTKALEEVKRLLDRKASKAVLQ